MSNPSKRRDDDEPEDLGGSYSFRNDKPKKKDDDLGLDAESEPRKREVRSSRTASSSSGDPPKKKKDLFWIIMGILIVGGGGGIIGYIYVMKSIEEGRINEAQERFGPSIAEYCKAPTAFYLPGQRPPAQGKLIIVDVNKNKVDALYANIDENLRAKTPEEVGTIVQLRWEERVVGRYGGGGDAKQWFCTVQLIDNATKKSYPPKQIIGQPPPSSTKSRGGVTGKIPHDEITQYLKAMMQDGNTP